MHLDIYLININIQEQAPSLSFPNMHLKIIVLLLELKFMNMLPVNINPFHGKDWTNDCLNQQQLRHISGIGTHHQNDSERQIQTIFNMSCAMLFHFALYWPQVAETNLWPFAVDYTIYIWNNIPGQEV